MLPMPWKPNPQEEITLTYQISIRFKAATEEELSGCYKNLLQAKGKKQAEAVLANCSMAEIQQLREAGFDDIASNSAPNIRTAVAAAPAEIARIRSAQRAAMAAAHEQQLVNVRINDYRGSIDANYLRHMQGESITLPIRKHNGTRFENAAVFYNNGEGVLPPLRGYIEWYAWLASSRSRDKRFFTAPGDRRLWYTEGGTHTNDPHVRWYLLDAGSTDWQKK
jgi:hypothetical protein